MRFSFLFLLAVLTLAPVQASAAPSEAPAKKVEIFVTSWCGYCKRLETFLKENNIEYKRYDVEKDPKGAAIFAQIGGEGVPVSRVGNKVVQGFDPDAILEALHA